MENVTITKKLFGGNLDFVIYNSQQKDVKRIVEEVYTEGLRLQKIFNLYDPKSELSRLNQLRKKKVSDELLSVIKKSLEFSVLTNGSYDIALGKSILLRKRGELITPTCSYKEISIKNNEIILQNPRIVIDLGSIAKGYIVDKLAESLQENGISEFLIDARGDICVRGKQVHVLGIQNPRKEENICSIKLKNQAVATSGDYNQYVGDFEKSHIINQKDSISVTVVAPTLEEADVYATAIFTSSECEQKKLIEANMGIKALIVKKGNSLKMFNGFKQLLYEE